MNEADEVIHSKQSTAHQHSELSTFLQRIISEEPGKQHLDYKKQMEFFYSSLGTFTYIYDHQFVERCTYWSGKVKNPTDLYQLHLYEFSCCLIRCMKKTVSYNVDEAGLIFTGLGKLCDFAFLKLTFDSCLSHQILAGRTNEALSYMNVTGAVFGGMWDARYIWNAQEIMNSKKPASEKLNLLRTEMSNLFIRKGSKKTTDAIMVYVPTWPKEQIAFEVKDVLCYK